MRALFLAFALTACSSTPMPAPTAQSAFPNDADLIAMLKSRVEDGRAAGLVLGVMEADGSTRVVTYGDAGPSAKTLDANSVFEIGSISKVFTGTLLADMAAKGEVKLDVPAQTYAPAGMVLPTRGGKEITLLSLSEQNSGLPRMPTNFAPKEMSNPYADYSPQQLNDFLAGYQLPRDIGAEFEYSNLGVGLLGNLLANRAGQSYEALVKARILEPLGMGTSGITLTPAMQAALAKGHDADGAVVANWDLPTLAGAGALRSSMNDMLKFLDANLGPPRNDLERAMRDAQAPRFTISPDTQIGFNWLTLKTGSGISIVWHNGGTGGYGSFIGFDPIRNIGVVLLANQSGVPQDIAMHLFDPAIPLAPKLAAPADRIAVDVPTATLARYVGVYALDAAPDFRLTVTQENGALFVEATGQQKFPVFPESETKVFYKVVDAQITFVLTTDGQSTHLVLHQGGANQKATKVD
jgi:serine-type D-Ala-D-Ala carboxypeptidase/endopeptidase